MATATQLMPASPNQGLKSAFSPYTDSPSSPAPFGSAFSASNRSSGNPSDSLHPPPSPYPAYVDPSPVDSNGTASTEIEDSAQEDPSDDEADGEEDIKSPDMDDVTSPSSQASLDALAKLDTAVTRPRSNSDEPQSVIHAPAGFKQFDSAAASDTSRLSPPSTTGTSEATIVSRSPTTPEPKTVSERVWPKSASATMSTFYEAQQQAQKVSGGVPPSPINTQIPSTNDRPTPRAQTRQELEDEWKRRNRANSSSLEDIAETDVDELERTDIDTDAEASAAEDNGQEGETGESQVSEFDQSQTMGQAIEGIQQDDEIKALKTALSECWTLCNTLAGLSQSHRQKMFSFSGKGETQEHAWRTCWRLCQRLYESRNEDHASQVRPTLELCRDFCQALFDVRQRSDEITDSVLRVSFELNNHLYNTHDRNLPEAFRERTLDFYLTLCHRLMKQRTSLPEETDALLRACWSLAEMLFSLRQNNRDGKPPDEELLGSAVQACWELCDLFREGWTQVRPDRGTPRPSQYTFPASVRSATVTGGPNGGGSIAGGTTGGTTTIASTPAAPPSELSSSVGDSFHSARSIPPETPTTIYDDREELSPEEPSVPNILILGPENSKTRTHDRWSSSASTLSGYSDTSARTSSTATAGREDPHLLRLKVLIVKAAMNAGYARHAPGAPTLPAFVKALPSNSFGSLPWQLQLLERYRKLVLADPTLRAPGSSLPARRLTAAEVARAVQWMGRSEQFAWMRDLYRFVFGFFPEDGGARGSVVIQT